MTSMFHPLQTFRHDKCNGYRGIINVKGKSAVEVLEETKPLYVKSSAVLKISSTEEKHTENFYTTRAPSHKKQDKSCDLELKLRRLLDSKDSLGEDFCYKTEVQYKSLPDLSTSSHESFVSTLHQVSCTGDDASSKAETTSTIDTERSSSEKSYGRPPSLTKSYTSLGGSAGKVEFKIWRRGSLVQEAEILRSKSDPGQTKTVDANELPPKLEEFFQFIGLSSQSYINLTAASSNGSNTVLFPSESSTDSSPKGMGSGSEQETVTDMGISIVERNARVIKWLVACAKS